MYTEADEAITVSSSWIAILFALAANACGVSVRNTDPGFSPPPGGVEPGVARPPAAVARRPDARGRIVCRGSGFSRDWVILDYVISPDCPAMGGERYNGALIVRHATYPRDSEVVVCADQPVPRGWRRGRVVDEAEFHSLCQSSLHVRPVSERVMRIHRQ